MEPISQPLLPQPNPDKIVDIPIEQLLLDHENARLAWKVDGNSQRDLLETLWIEMAVDEVAWSISQNGFFRSEPLFVIIQNPNETDPERRSYIAVEGNRRLAAVLLLRDPELRQMVGATELPMIDEARRRDLAQLPAIIYPDRESLWMTVGFRHINGIKPWDSFSKAKYVGQVHEVYGIALDEIAERIGDRHTTVRRLYRGYKILEQAEAQTSFDKEDRARNRFFFSHLYTAADQPAFQKFLGIDAETSLRPNPVPESHLEQLEELMLWLYGKKSEGIEPIVQKQNPDLNTLRTVISKPESLSALRRGQSLSRANEVAVGTRVRFRDALTNARIELENAQATVVTGYSGEEDLYQMVEEIMLYVESVRRQMRTKREELGIVRKPRTGRGQG